MQQAIDIISTAQICFAQRHYKDYNLLYSTFILFLILVQYIVYFQYY